ncbi:hypothetical protein ACJMK2_008175 [Sinanodonta woodiana]|uniref:Uncharacterized protein n=1 Tax=Sinanodonta woodiana TaxID=1069815 RepID=A0ABD3VMD0_SINWO
MHYRKRKKEITEMLAEYKREEDEYNAAVKNLEPLKTKTQELLATTEQQNSAIEKLQKIINDNNETINSLKKIKNLSIFDQIKNDLVDDLANSKDINKVNESKVAINKDKIKADKIKESKTKILDDIKGETKVNVKIPDEIRKETKADKNQEINLVENKRAKFDSNWNPQFPE